MPPLPLPRFRGPCVDFQNYILVFAEYLYRMCIPAEAEPILNSSSCYPVHVITVGSDYKVLHN
jgi:hypothetical protein